MQLIAIDYFNSKTVFEKSILLNTTTLQTDNGWLFY